MRKYLFAALVALCISVPGTVNATPLSFYELVESGEIDPALVDDILRAAAEQSEWSFEELWQRYESDQLYVDTVDSSYRVTTRIGGAIVIIELEDMI